MTLCSRPFTGMVACSSKVFGIDDPTRRCGHFGNRNVVWPIAELPLADQLPVLQLNTSTCDPARCLHKPAASGANATPCIASGTLNTCTTLLVAGSTT